LFWFFVCEFYSFIRVKVFNISVVGGVLIIVSGNVYYGLG
jgi:hypothetical protein